MTSRRNGYRLSTGGIIERTRTLQFTFNGRTLSGHPGDTLASALIANGVNLIARSFKYHRPRGIYGVGLEDPNSMLAVRDAHGYDPAIRAGQVRLTAGLEARSVSGYPSVNFDVGAAVQIFSGLLGAGFYYKTFKWPGWKLFEPFIRRMTGIGRARIEADHRRSEHRHACCDVLVIGAGPAGLITARALRGRGLSVVIADDQPLLGGSLLWETAQIDGQTARTFGRRILSELESDADFTLLPATLATGAYENNVFTLVQAITDEGGLRGERHWTLRAHQVVLATGMIDRPLLFEGNDRPGIMLSSSVRRLIGEFAVAPAQRLVIYTNNDGAYLTAIDACRAGMDVAAIVDTRAQRLARQAEVAQKLGIDCHFDSRIETTFGYRRLSGVKVRGRDGGAKRIACDGLASSGGWTPVIHLAAHRGIKPAYDAQRGVFLCRDLPPGWFAVGGVNAAPDLESVAAEAMQTAQSIAEARDAGIVDDAPRAERRRTSRGHMPRMPRDGAPNIQAASFGTAAAAPVLPAGSPNKIWVDLQNDVKVSDIALAVRENYTGVEHLKRYTTLGMGTDQGRTSNVNGIAVLAALTSRDMSEVGTTTFRPPYAAVRMATIANGRRGNLYRPRRYLAAHAVHRELGAAIGDFGWERPDWYRCNGEDREAAVAKEMRAVREHVGVFDGSSLGKIEITGPDARKFAAKFYVSNMANLEPGRIRYSLMLREDGVIFDDGVLTCIAENHFLAGTTSGNAEHVAAWFERWRQTEWPEWRVAVSMVTDNWAAIAIAGPESRELLRRLEPDFDASNDAFPHMRYREGTLGGVRARVARISFSGERQYEIMVPSRYAAALVRALLAEEGGLAPRPVGMEAWLRLRLEKGYLHLGTDTNGRTTPLDVGMGTLVAKRRDDFIGKRSLSLPFAADSEREQAVGLTALQGRLQVGGRILVPGQINAPCATEGYVTSACFSPSVGQSIGLALIRGGHARHGETVLAYCSGDVVPCRISSPAFYDPGNDRLQA